MTASSASSSSPSAPRPTVGVLGIGIMGSAISANLVKAGFPVVGYDPLPAARAALASAGAEAATAAEDAIRSAEFLILSLPSDAVLCDVSRQIAAVGAEGLRVAETSTLTIPGKQKAADLLASRGITLLDCPLSGTGAQAVTRDLAVYASGDPAAIEAMREVFDGFARVTYNIGAFGNGMRMKLMANLLVAIHNISAAEALLMGQRMGIDMDLAVKVLADGAGGSRMLQVRGPAMSAGSWDDATMKVSTWQKDMKLIAAELAEANVPAPLFSACIPIYNAAMGMGHGESDTAAVYDVLEKMSALRR
ncbi:MAG TPA: NAD(P)-dependent oxidoreductase [Bordetella sp.]|nr:NAD(P)-dependent oxidoreductase [Bordetella sp.]